MTKLERENLKLEREMEREIRKIYKEAQAEISLKYQAFKTDFNLRTAIYEEQIRQATASGDAKALAFAKYEYERFMKNSMFTDNRYLNMLEQVKAELLHANETALAYVNGKMPEVYAINFNGESSHLMSEIKELTGMRGMGVSWELTNPHLVRNMVMDGKTLLPYKEINGVRFERWETQRINNQMLRGIIQGESISKLADRLQNVTVMDREAAIRNARTMHTSAQGKACLDAMQAGKEKGIIMKKVWEVAAFDGRLRESHAAVAGEERELDEKFSNELMYPGDPDGDPSEVYNCRCTMKHDILGFQSVLPEEMQDAINVEVDGQSAEEWLEAHNGNDNNGNDNNGNEGDQVASGATEPEEESTKLSKADVDKPEVLENLESKWARIEKIPVGSVGSLTSEQIINHLAGGDMTHGSCASVGLAYAGMRAGFDVRDFRGGRSQDFFSTLGNLKRVATMEGVESVIAKGYNEIKVTNEMLKSLADAGKMPVGKEYYLIAGQHASIIRMGETGMEWLEMQSQMPGRNGWHPFESDTLRRRFGAARSRTVYGTKMEITSIAVDVESLANNPYFEDILGYINTEESKQKKGSAGHVR